MHLSDVASDSSTQTPGGTPAPGQRALGGLIAVAAALGFSELIAGVFTVLPRLISGIATFVIDNVPAPVKEWAIATFGTSDKLVLGIGIVVVALALGSVVGRASTPTQTAVFIGFGSLAGLASARSPQVGLTPALVAGFLSAGAGLLVLKVLASPGVSAAGHTARDGSRRSFLLKASAVGALAMLGGGVGAFLSERGRRVLSGRAQIALPTAVDPVAAPTPAATLDVPGITPLVVPNAEFYRIDTVPFSVPQVDIATWNLRVIGMVEREVTIDFSQLLDMPMVERYVTLSCVSNEVGGDLVGNAKWLGVPLVDVLDQAGVEPGAEQIVGRSVDGWEAGFPIDVPFDGRDALIAVGMNDEPLPAEHGYPARLVVSGLYGYVSATKWLSEIELTTWDGFDGYWIPRGWSKLGPVKTQSRIDTPRPFSRIEPGVVALAGVAWAPSRGVSRVEVSVDGEAFEEAVLSAPLTDSAWVQWRFDWNATTGAHTVQVRATDGSGETQTDQIARPAPDGATGYHTVSFDVT